jgi:hypothetical protein
LPEEIEEEAEERLSVFEDFLQHLDIDSSAGDDADEDDDEEDG